MINLEKGFNKAAAATLITLSAVMLAAVLVLTLVINSKKKTIAGISINSFLDLLMVYSIVLEDVADIT